MGFDPGPFSRQVHLNPITDSDSYKGYHYKANPPGLHHVYSYAESRGGKYPATLFSGLQPYLVQLANTPITDEMIEQGCAFWEAHGFDPNEKMWREIADEHEFLPLDIRAVDEGTLVPVRNALCTVQNTDPRHPSLTSFVETPLLRRVWYATTVATRIFYMRRKIAAFFDKSSDDRSGLAFALLDFMSRGTAGYDASEIAGCSYLSNGFMGSDNVPAVIFTNHYYCEPMSGFSVPASEHSVTTAWGPRRELERMRAAIASVPDGSILSDVIDTWNCFEAARMWVSLKDELAAKNITLVLRPDSGAIEDVLPELFKIAVVGFGYRKNTKGFYVLNGAKLLWGDGIDEDTCTTPFQIANDLNISADSIMVGSGGGLAQKNMDRDTCKFAFKASAICLDGAWSGVAKDPITDPGKRSKQGRFHLIRDETGAYQTITQVDEAQRGDDLLKPRYLDGKLFNLNTLAEIRARVDAQL